jgi:mRNA interferase MazF
MRPKRPNLLPGFPGRLSMNRGEIWSIRDDGYASKARPVLIVQSNLGEFFNSVILCLFTTFESSHIPTRVRVIPHETNGLKKDSFVMTEKLITIDKKELEKKSASLPENKCVKYPASLPNYLIFIKKILGNNYRSDFSSIVDPKELLGSPPETGVSRNVSPWL